MCIICKCTCTYVRANVPKEVSHVCVRCIDSTKSRENGHDSHSYDTNTTDQLLYGEDTCVCTCMCVWVSDYICICASVYTCTNVHVICRCNSEGSSYTLILGTIMTASVSIGTCNHRFYFKGDQGVLPPLPLRNWLSLSLLWDCPPSPHTPWILALGVCFLLSEILK